MDPGSVLEAKQQFNGGIIFVSFIISVVGTMTTLEMLTRRTHFTGRHNWLLLGMAAMAMGGVGIWSMHFIGNNSLQLIVNDVSYHLNYKAGYTFASLVVAIVCMFVAFAFVGVSEEAHLVRLIPSGTIAGMGIAAMHYIGQFAIDYFELSYKASYVVGSVVIACAAVNIALYVFFKLREHWTNQWYKRLGCAVLMAIAVCGMHYTGMAGTSYRIPVPMELPPTPKVSSNVIIGIISAIVVVACGILLYISIRATLKHLPIIQEQTNRKLMLCVVLFDKNGKILVNSSGAVPTREVLGDTLVNMTQKPLSASHPLFHRLLENTTRWTRHVPIPNQRPSEFSSNRTHDMNDVAEALFFDAAGELVDELKLDSLPDLGILFDTVINSNTAMRATKKRRGKQLLEKHGASWLLWQSKKIGDEEEQSQELYLGKERQPRCMSSVATSMISMDVPFAGDGVPPQSDGSEVYMRPPSAATQRSQNEQDTNQDQYLFLVRQIGSKEVRRLLSMGYRFADPIFISRTMGGHLRIPSEHMLNHFADMHYFSQTAHALLKSKPSVTPSVQPRRPSVSESVSTASLSSKGGLPDDIARGAVYVGLWALVQEDTEHDEDSIHVIVDKVHRNAFPMVQLKYSNTEAPVELDQQEKNCILSLQGQSLLNIGTSDIIQLPRESASTMFDLRSTTFTEDTASNATTVVDPTQSHKRKISLDNPARLSPGSPVSPMEAAVGADAAQHQQFLKALQTAAKLLMKYSSFGKPLGSTAKLHGEVIDVPPFALTAGPCQIIMFRTMVNIPGTVAAINQSFVEPIKCIPLRLYRTLAFYITDQAVQTYRRRIMHAIPEGTYLAQQQLYRSTASLSTPFSSARPKALPPALLPPPQPPTNHTATTNQQNNSPFPGLSSLPPPPRTKRPKVVAPSVAPSLSTLDETHSLAQITSIELPAMLTLLPAQDRFWWLTSMAEETLHGE